MCHQAEFACGQHFHHAPHGGRHYHCGCCCLPGYASRRFPTRQEMIEELEEYLKNLQREAKGVEERIAELRKEV